MRVLIADKFEESGIARLRAIGCDVMSKLGLKDEALAREVAASTPDVLVVRSTKVPEAVLSAGALKLVVRAGAGYNTIDVAAASRRGIYVSNCPGKNSIAVAELAFGLLLSLDRRIPENVSALRESKWSKSEYSKARGLFGRTLGLIGVGQIGREMVVRARAFGMPVVAWSRSLTPERAEELGVSYAASAVDVARRADAVSVHVALNLQTRGLLGSEFFAAMRTGAYFVNTARAEVVDEAALLAAVREKGVRAGLDVYADEPAGGAGEYGGAVGKEAGVYGTHHIGASTEQAQEAIAAETVRIIQTFKESGNVPNAVNLAQATPATCALMVRHLDKPGVLAKVLDVISAAHINVQEMENIVFEGAVAAVARINLESAPDEAVMERVRGASAEILEVSLIGLA
ncbi:MAG TPA: 3-phosphoglycerate dehydrogenase family protein [Candidatus Limnocylindrales bacterium]|nr:3-phosphoglycerate dehydrogenase family protein [Candidatus Limnocylindrales bacterium]